MDDKMMIPYIAHESLADRMERANKRLWLIIIILIAALVITNAAWLYVWQLYDYSSEESAVDIDADNGNANYVGNNGDITNGTNNSTNN